MSVKFNSEALQKHAGLAASIKETLETKGTDVAEKESHGAYYANLPEGLSKEVVEDLSKYNNAFTAASHVAFGEVAAEIFVNNPEAQKVNGQIGFFGKRDNIEMTAHREKTYRNNFAETEEDKELKKHLVISASVNVSGYGLKSIREAMSEEFKDKYAK